MVLSTSRKAVLNEINIDRQLNNVVRSLYDEATSAVVLDGNGGDFLRPTVGVRQGRSTSPLLFLMFLENIMQNTLKSQHPTENDRLATCGLLTTSICWEAVKNSNNSLKGWRKELLDMG